MQKLPINNLFSIINQIVSTPRTVIKEEDTTQQPSTVAQSVANYINLAKTMKGKIPGSAKADSKNPRTVTALEQPTQLPIQTKTSSELTPTSIPPVLENFSDISKEYYNKLDEALGVNLDAYGRDKKGKKRARRFLERLTSHPHTSWSGDTSTVEDLPNRSSTERVADPESFMKTAVADLMKNNPKMTHGQAQQQALGMLKTKLGQQ